MYGLGLFIVGNYEEKYVNIRKYFLTVQMEYSAWRGYCGVFLKLNCNSFNREKKKRQKYIQKFLFK